MPFFVPTPALGQSEGVLYVRSSVHLAQYIWTRVSNMRVHRIIPQLARREYPYCTLYILTYSTIVWRVVLSGAVLCVALC